MINAGGKGLYLVYRLYVAQYIFYDINIMTNR